MTIPLKYAIGVLAPAPGGAPTLVTAPSWMARQGGATTINLTITATTAGSTLIAYQMTKQSDQGQFTISDNQGGTWTTEASALINGNTPVFVSQQTNCPAGITTVSWAKSTGFSLDMFSCHEMTEGTLTSFDSLYFGSRLNQQHAPDPGITDAAGVYVAAGCGTNTFSGWTQTAGWTQRDTLTTNANWLMEDITAAGGVSSEVAPIVTANARGYHGFILGVT